MPKGPLRETSAAWAVVVILAVFGLVWVFNAYRLGRLKMTVRAARKLRDRLIIGGFVITLGAYLYEPVFPVGMVVMCACLVPHFLFNRCPHCGKHLGKNNGAFCQFCGKRIDG